MIQTDIVYALLQITLNVNGVLNASCIIFCCPSHNHTKTSNAIVI